MNGVTKNGFRTHSIGKQNPHLLNLDTDFMYHLGFSRSDNLPAMFSDVKFVLSGGTPYRMAKLALMLEEALPVQKGTAENNILKSDRYVMYKVGPVLCVNHGMGAPSISIMLIELIKLLNYAGATDVTFFRIGTSGGVGVAPGTTVITTEALNGELEPYYDQYLFGKRVQREVKFHSLVSDELLKLAGDNEVFGHAYVAGKTFAADDFYEGQARLDGLFCDYTEEDKFAFLRRLHDAGVVNIEMESVAFGAITHRAGIKGAMVTTALLNRMNGDQVTMTPAEKHDWEMRPCKLVIAYITKALAL